MKSLRGVRTALLLLGLGVVPRILLAAAASSAPPAPVPPPAEKSAVAACADCHDLAKDFFRNPHARIPFQAGQTRVSGDAVCASCHGNTSAHVESSGEKPVERVLRGRTGAEFCLTCHDSTSDHGSFRNGVHANTATVNCLSCHSIHAAPARLHLLAKESVALCESCHPGKAAGFRDKPFAHRLEGGMDCASCHDPHGRAKGGALRRTRGDELPCLSCHAEKRGPFVFEHVSGVAGDCMSCHEQHGSSNPKQLKRAQVSQLCLECHSPIIAGTLGSQPPSFHNIRLARYQNCTVCHVAIHGSNRSPTLLK
jgi:DmsE family decaheme c-type cytochrome